MTPATTPTDVPARTAPPRVGTPVLAEPAAPPADRPGRVRATLRPGTVVVARDHHTVQVGLAPDRAVMVTAPASVGARRLTALLAALKGGAHLDDVADRAGIDQPGRAAVARVLVHLADLGHLHLDPSGGTSDLPTTAPRPAPVRRVHILGAGQLADVLRGPLAVNGCRVTTGPSPGLTLNSERPPWDRRGRAPDLVILAGSASVDPLVVSALAHAGQAHMHAYCRDGRVVVGPTVVPGHTPCLRCTDLYRARRDPQWPYVAAQLVGHSPDAAVPALTAAAALVLAEVTATRDPLADCQTVGATVEINPAEGLWRRVEWQADESCGCGAAPRARPLP